MISKGRGRDPVILGPNISKKAEDRGLLPKEHEQEMDYGVSRGRVTDDVA